MSLDARIAGNIRRLLKSSDLKQNQLAVAVRCSPSELSRRMTGKNSFEIDLVADIADVLGVSFEDLVFEVAH